MNVRGWLATTTGATISPHIGTLNIPDMRLMKVLIALAFTSLSISAFAGPDWTVIERARAAARQANATASQPHEQATCAKATH